MKRHLLQSISFLCLLAAFSLASCSRMEEIPDNAQVIQQPAEIAFTATLAPKGENPQTKAISSGSDDNGKEILNVAWAVDEKIALYYQISGGYAKTIAEVTEVNDGVATIKAELDANTKDGGTVLFVYPASLANEKGDDIDESKLMTQYGKIDGIANSISKQFDAATGEGRIRLSGGTSLPTSASVTNTNTEGTGNVSLQSRVCICKFHLTVYTIDVNGELSPLTMSMNDDLKISDGDGHTYTIKSTKEWPGGLAPDGATGNPGYGTGDDIYVAMLPIVNKSLTLSATYNNRNYTLTTQPGILAAGKFYRNVPVTMQLKSLALTWNGGSTAWKQNDGKKNWLDADGMTNDFYNGDSVTFTARNAGTVTLWRDPQTPAMTFDLQTPAMTVNGGEYTFEGDGRLNITDLTVSGGDVRFAREIWTYKSVLSGTGTKLFLEQTLRLTGAFVQSDGTLVVDLGRLNGAAALSGEGKAELKIESGHLQLIGDTATPDGNTYTIASGFGKIAKTWESINVSGQANGKDVKYYVESDDTSVRVRVIDEGPFIDPIPDPDPGPDPNDPVPVTP